MEGGLNGGAGRDSSGNRGEGWADPVGGASGDAGEEKGTVRGLDLVATKERGGGFRPDPGREIKKEVCV